MIVDVAAPPTAAVLAIEERKLRVLMYEHSVCVSKQMKNNLEEDECRGIVPFTGND
jgi:hypothetical protein